jgi:hypothetical protein
VPPEEIGTNVQNVCVAFVHVYDIVVSVEIIPIVRKPDVDKSYSRVKLIGQIKILRLTEPKRPSTLQVSCVPGMLSAVTRV